MAFTETAIRTLRPTDKPFNLGDSAGLYLLIKPNGSTLWYMKYRFDGKEKKLALSPGRMFLCLRHASDAARICCSLCATANRALPEGLKSTGS